MNFPRELVRKYNRSGPRYTSYPTALQFTPEVDREALLREVREGDGDLSLYFHLPFCDTLCWFCGCNTVITKDRSRVGEYRKLLERDMGLFEESVRPGRRVVQLHFGGGTPNFFPAADILAVGQLIRDRFHLDPGAECSVELAPNTLTREHVEAFRSIGVTRASFGVQDTDPTVQKAIHRIQPHALNEQAMQWLREAGYESVNIDLMYGLPHQTGETYRQTLAQVLALRPDRIAVFNYAHVPWMRPAQRLLEDALPDPEAKLGLLQLITETLMGAGYEYIGLDHFALTGDELARARQEGTLRRNFQGYSTHAGSDIAAFGISAISQTATSYRQNLKDLDRYRAHLDRNEFPVDRGVLLSREDRIRRDLINAVMCDLEIDWTAMARRWDISPEGAYAREIAGLREFEADGLVQIEPGRLTVTPTGRFFLRNIAMVFDEYLGAADPSRFSRTV